MVDKTLVQQTERISGVKTIIRRWKFTPALIALTVCLCGGCGQAPHQDMEKAAVEGGSAAGEEFNAEGGSAAGEEFNAEGESAAGEEHNAEGGSAVGEEHNAEGESNVKEEVDTKEGLNRKEKAGDFPDNASIKDSICRYYGREEYEKISEEEIEAVRGKLSAYSLTVHSGEEFALMREWYDWDRVHSVTVYFSKDLKEWQEEELQALEILDDVVCVESDTATFPAHVLTYLTGAQEVHFSAGTDVSDVTGTLPEGACFPKQIKSVRLFQYREGKYSALLQVLEDSQVETITIRADSGESAGFWLDDAAGIRSLRELNLENIAIRVRDASLAGSGIVGVKGDIDKDTDLCFVEELTQLRELHGSILEERDLLPLLRKKGLSLYLDFCRGIADGEGEPSGNGMYTVCPDFNREVSWSKEAGEEIFLAIYQRRYTHGRMAECFTEREVIRKEDEIESFSLAPWIRVTDSGKVYELRPGEEREEFGFGDARTDWLSVKDINFDGVEDIVLEAGHFGNQGLIREFGYLWNRKSGRYEFAPTYTMIANPSIDSEHQLVRSSWRNWAASHSWAIYRYADGEFVMQSMLTEEPLDGDDIPAELEVPEGAEVWCWREDIMENGEVADVKYSYAVLVEGVETVYPEGYESYYEEDSYWGYRY